MTGRYLVSPRNLFVISFNLFTRELDKFEQETRRFAQMGNAKYPIVYSSAIINSSESYSNLSHGFIFR